MCFCDWLLVTNYLKNSLLCVYTTLFHPLSYELSLEPFLGYLNYISVLSSLTKIKILFFLKKGKKKRSGTRTGLNAGENAANVQRKTLRDLQKSWRTIHKDPFGSKI